MKTLLITFISLVCLNAYSQISKSDQHKVKDLLGPNMIELAPQKSYYSEFECSNCTFDTSLVNSDIKDGAIYNGEFILHHNPISLMSTSELFKSIRTGFVSISEYDEFEHWVRDSISMVLLYNGFDAEPYWLPFLRIDGKKISRTHKRNLYKAGDGRDYNRAFIHFDPYYQLDYKKHNYDPIIAKMYLPEPERFVRKREFDKRKFIYYFQNYNSLHVDSILAHYPNYDSTKRILNGVPTMRSEYQFAQQSENKRDSYAVFGQLAMKTIKNIPVYGLKGFQAMAFCHWKTETLQRSFDKKKLPYTVIVTLPSGNDSDQFPIKTPQLHLPERDYTDHWQITNEDYLQFMEAVKDSIIREHLFFNLKNDEDANQYLKYSKIFFSRGDLEYLEFDKSDRDFNREKFNLNYSSKINRKNPEVDAIVRCINIERLTYHFFELDAHKRSLEGKIQIGAPSTLWKQDDYGRYSKSIIVDTSHWGMISYYRDANYIKNGVLGRSNCLGESFSIPIYGNWQVFISDHRMDLIPANKAYPPRNTEIIQNINYEQALAN